MIFGKPIFETIPFWLPAWIQELYIRFGFFCKHGKLSDYGLPTPKYSLYDHPLSIGDQIFQDIRKGRCEFLNLEIYILNEYHSNLLFISICISRS